MNNGIQLNLFIDGTNPEDGFTTGGDFNDAPFYVFDVEEQKNVAGPYNTRVEAAYAIAVLSMGRMKEFMRKEIDACFKPADVTLHVSGAKLKKNSTHVVINIGTFELISQHTSEKAAKHGVYIRKGALGFEDMRIMTIADAIKFIQEKGE